MRAFSTHPRFELPRPRFIPTRHMTPDFQRETRGRPKFCKVWKVLRPERFDLPTYWFEVSGAWCPLVVSGFRQSVGRRPSSGGWLAENRLGRRAFPGMGVP